MTSWGVVEAWLAVDGRRRVGFYASNARGLCAWVGVYGEDPDTLPSDRLHQVDPGEDPSATLVRAIGRQT